MQKKFPQFPILIIDDEEDVLKTFANLLTMDNITNFILCKDSRNIPSLLNENPVSLIILDLTMPYVDGKSLLPEIHRDFPGIPIIVNTGTTDVETVVFCMKAGAFDYILKSEDQSRLISVIRKALEINALKSEVTFLARQVLRKEPQHPEAFARIITANESMQCIFKYIEAVAPSPKTVLITGETGVGKELIAAAIHACSGLKGNFIKLNVAGLDDLLFSDTLFGHTRGAYTGADETRLGLIEQAGEGTLFLDEIGNLDLNAQIKLLRLLQEGTYYSLGSDQEKTSDARIIAATNENLEARMNTGQFRKDLYYRLNTHYIHVPPLRERRDDIPLLAEYFTARAAAAFKKPRPEITGQVYAALLAYTFPGNIRELEAQVFNAVSINSGDELALSAFDESIASAFEHRVDDRRENRVLKILTATGEFPTLRETEDYLVENALLKAKGNQSIAARMIGISQPTMHRRFKSRLKSAPG